MSMIYVYITTIVLVVLLALGYRHLASRPKKLEVRGTSSRNDFCIIDIRDYISSHRSPYPNAENIPLSYLNREMKERYACRKEILLITDDFRGARLAAKIIRKNQSQTIYYVQP
ncbi:rhodanese-like domain-containing protein [Halobacillus salinus]|uniref:Rhodanese-like domain-containing protein n=1 Tax=Halobacillus salinus TaxID=192814 RepID=A0A4Z0GZG9_9BACI|nr:rhodanese-like domain-containing protein [Halobacillus salinus]TGB02148.1 rhodanese-like domain-containing protein [Halobacillus salinus]